MNTMHGLCLLLAAALSGPIAAASATGERPFQPQAGQLHADYWIARLPDTSRPLLDAAQVQRFNAHLLRHGASMHDLQALPDRYTATQVRARVLALSAPPSRPLYDASDAALDAAQLAALQSALALDAIPAQVTPRYALVVRRADLRTFPTRQRVFSGRDDHDIDRFQESALYPGTAVAILHVSRDGQWLFVLAPNYAAWIERERVAEGERAAVLGYAQRTPRLVVTGARALTAFTRNCRRPRNCRWTWAAPCR